MHEAKFEVGNAVLVNGRVTTVEKVYANGNFKISGVDGQWRQSGWKAGTHGYRTPRCVHYTAEVAAREARRKADIRFRNAAHDLGRYSGKIEAIGTLEEVEAMAAQIEAMIAALLGSNDQ